MIFVVVVGFVIIVFVMCVLIVVGGVDGVVGGVVGVLMGVVLIGVGVMVVIGVGEVVLVMGELVGLVVVLLIFRFFSGVFGMLLVFVGWNVSICSNIILKLLCGLGVSGRL